MISSRGKASLDRMVMQGLLSALPGTADGVAQVKTVDSIEDSSGGYMVVLMLASHSFRLVIAMYVAPDQATREYLEALGRLTAVDQSSQSLRDAISECANVCCGTVNREIGRFYLQTGMSTPYLIDSRSGAYVAGLEHQHLQHFHVAVGGTFVQATLSACARREMDFDWQADTQPEASGELELF